METDLVIQWTLLALAALVFFVCLIGGLVTAATGVWTDGERTIILTQMGPIVRGESERPGGREKYSGYALFNTLWLSRRDEGKELLISMGFPAEAVKEVSGMVTARLRMRVRGDVMGGAFVGMRFRFSGKPQRVASATPDAPSERIWQRISG